MDEVQDMVGAVEHLWPDAAEVRTSRHKWGPGERIGAADLLVVPSLNSPRMLVPTSRRGAFHALQRFSSTSSIRDVAERLGIATVAAVAGPARVFDRLELVDPGDGITSHFADLLGQKVLVSVTIGSRRANRKPVLQVFDRSGRPLAHAKVGDTDVASGHVRGEAEALRRLADRLFARVAPPQLIHHGRWRDLEVLLMTSVATSPWHRRGRHQFPAVAMTEIFETFREPSVPLDETPAWQRWVARADALSDPGRRSRLVDAMGAVARTWSSTALPVGAWHGDFTPWNMGRNGPRLSVWDWERFETGVPLGLDAVHYAVNVRTRQSGFTSSSVSSGLAAARGLVPRDVRPGPVLAAYLTAISVRYLGAAEGAGGVVIDGSAIVMLEALERCAAAADRFVA
jgi:Phosphotransferase enzyme family